MGKYYKLPLQSLELPLLTVVFLCLGLDQSFVHGEVPDSESVAVVVLSGAFLSAAGTQPGNLQWVECQTSDKRFFVTRYSAYRNVC